MRILMSVRLLSLRIFLWRSNIVCIRCGDDASLFTQVHAVFPVVNEDIIEGAHSR